MWVLLWAAVNEESTGRGDYHHGHLVQRGLPIKQHNIAILQVTLHFVAWLQVDIAVLAPVAQVKALPVLPDDEASTSLAGRWVGTILYQLLQPAEAVRVSTSPKAAVM